MSLSEARSLGPVWTVAVLTAGYDVQTWGIPGIKMVGADDVGDDAEAAISADGLARRAP
jgi:hypothetical protein